MRSLATEARVSPDDIATAATQVDQQRTWIMTEERVQRMEAAKEILRKAMVALACDALKGNEVTFQDFAEHLFREGFTKLTNTELYQLFQETQSLIDELDAANKSSESNDRIPVAFYCYVASSL
ncbi:MAG: hypothetical protein JO249_02515 [Acidobacteria bacterium]|nr:hypothetical protein [Acidobacteriota bacterium]